MKTRFAGRFARPLLGVALAALVGSAVAATAEPLDLDADLLAEIARHKARATVQSRQTASAGKRSQSSDKPAAECGAISIGNVIGGSRIGFSPVDINVIILGDIVNANNRCR